MESFLFLQIQEFWHFEQLVESNFHFEIFWSTEKDQFQVIDLMWPLEQKS